MDTVFAYAENIRDTKFEKIEKISIKNYEKVERSEDMILLHWILLQLDDKNIDQETKEYLITWVTDLQAKLFPAATTHHVKEMNKLFKENQKLIDAYYDDQKFAKWMHTELVGFGIDAKQELLFIDIEPTFANQKHALKYKEKIESLLSPSTNFEFRQIERPQNVVCNSQTSNCDALEGGIKISIDNGHDCSIGFKANDGNTAGFITAGHCGDIDEDVKYPNSPNTKIGEVTKNGFVGDDTYCDCLFVKLTGNVTMDDIIYPDKEPDAVGKVKANLAVTMKGYSSGTITANIHSPGYSVTIGEMFHKDHMRIDKPPLSGDSGGPVYIIVNGTEKLLGFISAVQDGQYTIASKAKWVGYELSNVSLDFD